MSEQRNLATQPTPIRPAAPPNPVAQRTAAAFAEIKNLEDTVHKLFGENTEARRELDRRANQIELLDSTLEREREQKEIYQRKLVRLATAMAGIGALCAEAVRIMEDVKEVEEARARTVAART